MSTFAPLTAGILPAIVAELVGRAGFTEVHAGHIGSLYSFAGMLAGLSGLLWIRRIDRRAMLVAVVILGLCADLSAVWLHGYVAIALGRLATGLAASTAVIIVNATIALSHHSKRLFGIVLTSQSLLTAVLFFALPRLSWGASGLFLLLAFCWAVALPFALVVPRAPATPAAVCAASRRSSAHSLARASIALLLLAFLCFYVATGASWTFLSLIGEWHGIASTSVGSAMSLAMLSAIAGGLGVTLLSRRHGRSRPLIVALVANVAFTAVLLLPIGAGAYTLAVCGMNALFAFALVLFLTLLGDEDPEGRLLSAGNLIIFGGLALGAWLFAPSTVGGDYRTLLLGALSLFAISPALLCIRRRLRRRSVMMAEPAPADGAALPGIAPVSEEA